MSKIILQCPCKFEKYRYLGSWAFSLFIAKYQSRMTLVKVQWYMSLILAIGGISRQISVNSEPRLHSKFHNIQGYIMRAYSKK